jgi:branched-chain amino acid transport system ATP-binding protein
MDVQKGEVLGILGPNGSGKTTLFNLITGVHRPDGGRVMFEGRDISGMSVHQRCRLGFGRTYQIPRPFGNMTVLENLLTAATQGGRQSERAARGDVDEILELTGLTAFTYQFARRLTLLDRKRLETARALATRPRLLLLDEIAGGLTEAEAHEVLKIIRAVNEKGVTIIWIEHLMAMMEGVDRILALDQGRNLLCGKPKDVMSSEEVVACYMGVEDD